MGDHRLGSSFNFEDRLGVGLKLSDTRKLGLRALHYSNGGLQSPNEGVESYSLYYGQAF
ncbi:Lipid A deacylase PagL precursor [compost metagenome]